MKEKKRQEIQGKTSWNGVNYLRRRVVIDDYPEGYEIRCFRKDELHLSVEDRPNYVFFRRHANFLSIIRLIGIFLGDIILGGEVNGICWCGSKKHHHFTFHDETEEDIWDTVNKYICPNCGDIGRSISKPEHSD